MTYPNGHLLAATAQRAAKVAQARAVARARILDVESAALTADGLDSLPPGTTAVVRLPLATILGVRMAVSPAAWHFVHPDVGTVSSAEIAGLGVVRLWVADSPVTSGQQVGVAA